MKTQGTILWFMGLVNNPEPNPYNREKYGWYGIHGSFGKLWSENTSDEPKFPNPQITFRLMGINEEIQRITVLKWGKLVIQMIFCCCICLGIFLKKEDGKLNR